MSSAEKTKTHKIKDEPIPKGAVLKKIREEKGIKLETIHEATKVPLDALRAIEEGYTVRTLSDFYYRSFVKIYAKYLDIDASQVLDEKKPAFKPAPVEKTETFEPDLLEKADKFLTKERKRQLLYVLTAVFSLWLLFQFISFVLTRKPSEKPQTQTVSQRQMEVEQRQTEVIQRQTAPPPRVQQISSSTEKSTPNPLISKDVVLTVRAKKGSWLRVKTDGNTVFQSTLKAGDVETWSADETIEITGRNISQLEFELNGKLIGSLGRASREAKGLIVTKEGLAVTK